MIRVMSSTSLVYEERRGWVTRSLVGLAIILPLDILTLIGAVALHIWVLLFFTALLTVAAYTAVRGALSRAVALRLDEHGVTLTKQMLRSTTDVIPWSDVTTIALYYRGTSPTFGVYKDSTAQAIGAGNTSTIRRQADVNIPIDTWSIDTAQLRETTKAYAPSVLVRDDR